ncbi:ABC transporter permease [Arthrobacter sp. GMC3]|uniref:ABC transporter permease n=1 Tax=Arthrobacter sp. GMC3 TaxID=2058894 RepID=UPI000CE326E3|nr:ABC transporter permease [Arthrobacter sp. GMC3]
MTLVKETAQASKIASDKKSEMATRIRASFQQLLAFASLLALVVFFSVASENFYQAGNLSNILLSTVVTGLLALGTTFVIITGGIDLSIGTGMTLCSVMTAWFMTQLGFPMILGVLAGVAFGALIGSVNGFFVAVLKIPSFIATLAMMMVAAGLALVISGTKPIYTNEVAGFQKIFALGKSIPGLVIPNAVFILFAAAIIAGLILSKTVLGRYTYSIGSNEQATALSGVNVTKWTVLIYTLAGSFTGLAGVIATARLNSAQPAGGMGLELQAIAAVVIGGTSLQGGKGSIIGTVIGALIMSVLTNGLTLMSIPQEWQQVAVGVVIILAVYLDMMRRKKTAK